MLLCLLVGLVRFDFRLSNGACLQGMPESHPVGQFLQNIVQDRSIAGGLRHREAAPTAAIRVQKLSQRGGGPRVHAICFR